MVQANYFTFLLYAVKVKLAGSWFSFSLYFTGCQRRIAIVEVLLVAFQPYSTR